MTSRLRSLSAAAAAAFAAAWLTAGVPLGAQGEDGIAKAKDLYASAAYDEALVALASADSADARQYRALCLLALGRSDDAEKELEELVTEAPSYELVEDEVPPRFAVLFADTQRRVLPPIVRDLFAEARQQFQDKKYPDALKGFERVATMVKEPALADVEGMSDMGVLAGGFIDLAKAFVAPPPRSAPAVESTPVARPSPPVAAAPKPAEPQGETIPPVAVRQDVPPWRPTLWRLPTDSAVGVMRVVIDRDGSVKEVSMQVPIHPAYDQELLEAARQWRYKPAMRNGAAVDSEKLITIRVEGK
jgi:TonB family protein